jgi:hypothetical protein
MNDDKKKCYAYAEKLLKMKPWLKFSDHDWILISRPDESTEDPANSFALPDNDIFCNILGNAGKVYGVALYKGEVGLHSLLAASQEAETEAAYLNFSGSQECITLYFDPVKTILEQPFAECLEPEYLEKKGKVPYFVEFTPGYFPHKPKDTVYKDTASALKDLLAVLKQEEEEDFFALMDSDHNILSASIFDNEHGEDVTLQEVPHPVASLYAMKLPVLTDEEVKSLTAGKDTNKDGLLIIDSCYTQPVMNNDDVAIMPKILLLIDEKGMIIEMRILSPDDDLHQQLIGALKSFIAKKGIPGIVGCRRDDLMAILDPFFAAIDPGMASNIPWDEVDSIYTDIQKQMDSMNDMDMPS